MSKPNIVLVMSDEMRYDCMGRTSNGFVRTPALDALAREGVFFENAFVSTPLCIPARVSLFTGRYSHATGVSDNRPEPMADPLDTMVDIFSRAGYATSLCGKNHLFTDVELPRRFDHVVEYGHFGRISAGGLLAEKDVTAFMWQVFARYWVDEAPFPIEVTPNCRITDEAIGFLNRRDPARPFFLWLSYVDPHGPIMTPKPYAGMYDPAAMPPWPTVPDEYARKPFRQRLAREGDLLKRIGGKDGMNHLRAAYTGMVTYVSDQVGRFVDELARRELRDNTIVVFTSDHGDHQGNHGLTHKSVTLYDDLIRVPLIINSPGRIAPRAVSDTMVDQIDLMPTLLDLAGLETPDTTDGRSLAPLLRGETRHHRDAVFGEYGFEGDALRPDELTPELRDEIFKHYTPEFHPAVCRGRFRSIRTRDWKYVHYSSGERELYDLKNDPLELTNLAGDPHVAATENDLRARLLEWSIAATDPLGSSAM